MNRGRWRSVRLGLIATLAAAACLSGSTAPPAGLSAGAPLTTTAASFVDPSTRETVPEAAPEPAALTVPTPEAPTPTAAARAVEPSPTATPARAAMPTSATVDAPAVPAVTPASLVAAGQPSTVVSRGRTDCRAVTFTFDAGTDRGNTERILDVLAREHLTAAFGITGAWGNANRDLLARITRDGHVLINHSYDHPSFTGVSWSQVARTRADRDSQLRRTAQVFTTNGGPASTTAYFRPPFGDYDAGVLADVGALGYPLTIMWSVDSMGWRGWTASQITQRCLEGAHSGAIYIFHVGAASRDSEALPAVIDGLRARGYEIVSLPQLLG